MNRWLKRIVIGLGALVVVGGTITGGYVFAQTSAFDESMDQVYDVPIPNVTRSTDPAVIARGKHLVESIGACAVADCHGKDLAGGKTIQMGPLGSITGPNITPAGFGAAYSDGELARLLRHGVKKDGRSARLMPSQEFNWLPESDVIAIISYVRTVPPVDRPNGDTRVGALGKIMDRRGAVPFDIARRIDHTKRENPPPPEPTAAYGKFIVRLCTGCHGEHLSGGPIPGAPPDMAIPANITPHETGIKNYSYEEFERLMKTGIKKDGKKLDPMMSTEAIDKMDDIEKKALFAYLMSVPPTPFGNR